MSFNIEEADYYDRIIRNIYKEINNKEIKLEEDIKIINQMKKEIPNLENELIDLKDYSINLEYNIN